MSIRRFGCAGGSPSPAPFSSDANRFRFDPFPRKRFQARNHAAPPAMVDGMRTAASRFVALALTWLVFRDRGYAMFDLMVEFARDHQLPVECMRLMLEVLEDGEIGGKVHISPAAAATGPVSGPASAPSGDRER
jgi:hypothetical protein